MKNRKIIYALLVVIITIGFYIFELYYPEDSHNSPTEDNSEVIDDTKILSSSFDYLPSSTTNQVIKHDYFSLSYSETHEQAEWVAYELKASHISRTNRKRPYFIYDKKVKTTSANYRNYKNSGYDRGHLCPAGDRKFSKDAFNDTFFTSNISPQKHDFNSGIWNRLEQKTRYWASKDKHLYVITGGILKNGLKTIGQEKVTVPEQFYKILLDFSKPQIKAIAFLIPHKGTNAPLYNFVVSIDEIEELTSLDFFPNLPNDLEDQLEKSSNYKKWSF